MGNTAIIVNFACVNSKNMNLTAFIAVAALVIFLCVLLNNASSKLGMPMLLAFILLGMVFGVDGVFKIKYDDFPVTEDICTVALIFIIFYGGFGTRWKEARPVFGAAALLSTLGVFLTAGLTGLFCHYVLKMDVLLSFLIGAVLSSTDAASVFSILRSRKLGLKYGTASMLEVESGSNDPMSYMLTILMVSVIDGAVSGGKILYMVFAQFVYGAAIGLAVGVLAMKVMKKFKASSAGFDSLFVLAIALFSYSLPGLVGGNGYLSAYIAGIILGNSDIRGKKTLVPFFDGVNGMMQVLIFFLLGLLSTPSKLPEVALFAVAVSIFMILIARPLTIFAVLPFFKCKFRQQLLVSFVGLRGAASVVFAIMATPAATHITDDNSMLFNIVLTVVLISIALQGSMIPWVSRKLGMIDKDEDIMKTFTDYSEETDVCFVQLEITEKDQWNGKVVKDLPIPNDTIVAVVIRDGKAVVPSGKTRILAGDKVIMSAIEFDDQNVIHLSERKIEKGNEWIGKKVFQYSPQSDELIVLIRRGDNVIIPRGGTVICEGDIMVINKIR